MNTQPLSRIEDEYELVHDSQDVRGWQVRDRSGRPLGHVQDLIIDTDGQRVVSLVLDTGALCPVQDISLGDGVVLLDSGVRSSRRSLTLGPQAPAPAPPSALTSIPIVHDHDAAPARPAPTQPMTVSTQPLAASGLDSARTSDVTGSLRIPVIEEQIRIGKRQVERGGVRLTARMAERPVQEQVTLREEHVHVERHPVDRPVTAGTAPFERRSVDVVERAEEAVVAKQARVVEEVVVTRDTEMRQQPIHESVRRTEVDIKPIGGIKPTDAFNASSFQGHYQQNFASGGLPFDRYEPAYRFGYQLRSDPRLSEHSWRTLEPMARQHWENHSPGTWERFKDAILHGWYSRHGRLTRTA